MKVIRLPYRMRHRLQSYLYPWPYLLRNVHEVRNLKCLASAMNWTDEPILDFGHLHQYEGLVDLNYRRYRDAEVVGSACRNQGKDILLEIGTAYGEMTALMASNSPSAIVYTVNILPEEIDQGGKLVTFAPTRDEIGRFYRDAGISNIRQIYANTANWAPEFAPIDVAFIDGSHDAKFVYNDTVKILGRCQSGSLIMWHDFAPHLAHTHRWIAEVCHGVDRLYADRHLVGPILHLQDSWIGLYRVP